MNAPEKIVQQAEDAYNKQDIDTIMEFFDPEIVVFWNGKKIAQGLEEVRALHEAWGVRKEFVIKKSLRAAMDNRIAVEWETSWLDEDSNKNRGYGGEFWTMNGERMQEWHAYYTRYVEGADGVERKAGEPTS